MKGQSQKVIQFSKQFIRKTNLYFVHEATVNGEKCLAKLFNQEIIQKYGLDEALEYQMEVFNETPNTIFPQYFMHLEAASTVNNAVITITKYYDLRLDQLIRKGPLNQKQAMQIFQNILKATYSLVMEGYSHRNMRPEHFVKAGNLWKLESVVYEENVNSKGLSCQYVANAEYHPPQAYKRPNFTEEELDRRIVWDLGCILISMILGGHRLKNQATLDKFKNQSFSFSAIGAKAGQKTSKQLQEMLGKMCHYNENKRMTFPQLLMSGFFSKQVAAHYKKYKESKKSKIFVGSNSSLSQSLSSRGQKQTAQQIQLPPNYNNWVANDQKKEYEYSTHGNNDKIATDMDFKKKVDIIIEQQFESSSIMNKTPLSKKISDINNEEYDAILNVYKNYLDKGEILSIGGRKFQKMLKLFGDVNIGREIVEITQYALKFVQVMDLCKLAKAMNQNKEFFEFNKKSWEAFHGSKEYKAIREIVNSKKNIQFKVFQEYRNRLIGKNKNRFVVDKNHLKDFVEEYSPEDLSYKDIKQPYRKILKVSYDTIAEHYSTNKTEEWAQLGMYITFCIAIDKFYIPEDFKSNFKFYFAWSKKQPCNYVSLVDFQDYLDHAPRIKLVQNSRYIMQKYFDV